MWIAFRIVFLLGIRSKPRANDLRWLVVNCFQNCIFTWHSQFLYICNNDDEVVNCFQNCIFTWHSQLVRFHYKGPSVVNCFQNCIFTWHSQFDQAKETTLLGCELLSELYFYLAFAVRGSRFYFCSLLWIAFRIVFLLGIRSI